MQLGVVLGGSLKRGQPKRANWTLVSVERLLGVWARYRGACSRMGLCEDWFLVTGQRLRTTFTFFFLDVPMLERSDIGVPC
eukprot:9267961-Karenia_brevis.AAC.1